jgi:hypothetical protein
MSLSRAMRKIYIILAIILLALPQAKAEKIEGYFIAKSMDADEIDTTFITFNIPVELFSGEIQFQKLQNGVKCYDKFNRKITVTPHTATEISFIYNGEKVRMLSCKNHLGVIGLDFINNSA